MTRIPGLSEGEHPNLELTIDVSRAWGSWWQKWAIAFKGKDRGNL